MPDHRKSGLSEMCKKIREIATTSREVALALVAILTLILALIAYERVGADVVMPVIKEVPEQ